MAPRVWYCLRWVPKSRYVQNIAYLISLIPKAIKNLPFPRSRSLQNHQTTRSLSRRSDESGRRALAKSFAFPRCQVLWSGKTQQQYIRENTNRNLFGSLLFPQVILVLKEQNKLDEIEELAHRACKLYQQQGSPEAGASSLEKAAKIVEQTYPEHALKLYQHAVEVVTVSAI